METHVRILGILNIALGAMGLLVAVCILLFFGGIAGVVGTAGVSDADAQVAVPILGIIGIVGAVFVALVSIPGVIAGWGLLGYREWARILTLVLSAINLLNIPFGTALGIYGLWALLQPQTVTLFKQRRTLQQFG